SRAGSLESTLPRLLDRALNLCGFEAGAIFLLDPEGRTLRLEAIQGTSDRVAEAYRSVAVGEGIIGEVARDGARIVVRDTATDGRVMHPVVVAEGIRAFITVPILSRGKVLGVLDVGTTREMELTEEHLSAASAVAHHTGVMLDNARLLIRSRQGERLYRHILDSALDLTFLSGSDFRVIRVNRRGLEFLGLSREEAKGRDLERLVGEDAFPLFTKAREHLVRGSRKGSLFEATIRTGEGNRCIYEFQSELIREEGERYFLYFVGRNLNRRKELESRLLAFTDRLTEMVESRTAELREAKNRFAYLFDVASRIPRLGTMDEKLRLITKSVAGAGLYRHVWIQVRGDDGRPLSSASFGFPEERVRRIEEFASAGLCGETAGALRIGGSFFLPAGGGAEGDEEQWREGDLLVVPLVGSDEPFGCLVAERPVDGRRPTGETAQVLELFVAQAAHAFEEARLGRRLAEAERLRSEYAARFDFSHIVGSTPAMERVIETIRRLAPVRTSVLITGESGTGKEMVAHAIHYNGPRREEPFVQVNCAAIPEPLLESELFGIERGVATDVAPRIGKFEQADGGTLFLDEVGDMSLATQSKVLRALQERAFERVGGKETIRVNVRIVAATNRDLHREIEAGRFRRDLLYRLNVVTIPLPPLRERREDIPELVDYFMGRCAEELGKPRKRVPPDVLRHFQESPWPGNIRQLRNCIERTLVFGREHDEVVRWEDLPSGVRDWAEPVRPEESAGSLFLAEQLEARERELIEEALRRGGGVQREAARLLGISERAMWYRVKKLGIDVAANGKGPAGLHSM
ncbi:MAG: sigma 54-interacting transcriptional regulator, partial [Candidatus Eisenbacteria bacterium]